MQEVTVKVKRTIVQFSFERPFEMFQCSLLEEVTEEGSPFQMVGAAWLKARSVGELQFVFG